MKIHDTNYIDIIFTGAILHTDKHQMLDLYINEKTSLSIRSDITLPKEIQECIDEQHSKARNTHKVEINLSVGTAYQLHKKRKSQKKRRGWFSFMKCWTRKPRTSLAQVYHGY